MLKEARATVRMNEQATRAGVDLAGQTKAVCLWSAWELVCAMMHGGHDRAGCDDSSRDKQAGCSGKVDGCCMRRTSHRGQGLEGGGVPSIDAVAKGAEKDQEAQQHHVLDDIRVELPHQLDLHANLREGSLHDHVSTCSWMQVWVCR